MEGRIKFVKVRHGDRMEFGDSGLIGVSGRHKYLGFKPGRAGRTEGWLVFLVIGNKDEPTAKRE